MNTNGYNTAVEIVEYLATQRQVGHTTAMIEGANANSLIITHTEQYANELREKTDATCMSLGLVEVGTLRGTSKKPLFIDNAATLVLLGNLISEIAGLRRELKEAKAEKRDLDDKIRLIKKVLS